MTTHLMITRPLQTPLTMGLLVPPVSSPRKHFPEGRTAVH
jgi:hypothetical protein